MSSLYLLYAFSQLPIFITQFWNLIQINFINSNFFRLKCCLLWVAFVYNYFLSACWKNIIWNSRSLTTKYSQNLAQKDIFSSEISSLYIISLWICPYAIVILLNQNDKHVHIDNWSFRHRQSFSNGNLSQYLLLLHLSLCDFLYVLFGLIPMMLIFWYKSLPYSSILLHLL